ncbi:MAG: N-acetylmuramoyl-L-alanine amidase [Deltaproteobacteria bacterium]
MNLVLDAGHGGKDPGAAYNSLRESDISLGIALSLKELLEGQIYMTRTSDVFVELKDRTALANKHNADLISLHCNAAEKPEANGSEIWCFAREDAHGKETEGSIMAGLILKELCALGFKNRGVKAIYDNKSHVFTYRPLWVLKETKQTALIIECGFLSNKNDTEMLRDFKSIAGAIFKGLNSFKVSR